MNVLSKGLTALALISTIAISSVVPTQAQSIQFGFGQRDRVITSYCDRNPRDRDCRSYYGGGWHDSDYNRFYRSRRSGLDSIASGLFGFGFGAILGSAIANSNNNDRVIGRVYNGGSSHVQACYARYRSYDANSDTYMGYDGYRHRCNL
ncbi:MAG: BA14K-like protein [Devosia sp.]|uniref:BA14K family protein n=1 Tax=Devosia sp. TaxID=1871048 RepID=UPI00263041F1|nr:BA14K family protein [Devosia sp.]MDB5531207.1 BA14K-like protein [Devosia sp.]